MKKTPLPRLVEICALLLLPVLSHTQPLPCGNPASMTSFCLDACVVCDIDGFTGINDSGIPGEAPPGFCTTTVHNAQWIAFRAASTNLTLSVSVSNCASGGIGSFTGLEVGIYESSDCENFQLISNCDGDIPPGTTQNFTTIVPLEIGQYYYFVMDGNDGDICTYVIDVVSGSTQVPLLSSTGPITGVFDACPGSTLTYTTPYLPAATIYQWTVNGAVVGQDTALNYTWPGVGTYQLCVTAKNVCDEAAPTCQFVNIATIDTTVYVEHLCGGDSLMVADTVLYQAGFYEFHYQTPADCDSLIQVTITAAPNQVTNLALNICDGDTLFVGGNPYTQTGIFQENLTTWLGCDSTVNLDLIVVICEIQASIGASQVLCFGGTDGIVTFSVLDGTPPFTYNWERLGQPGPSGAGNLSGVNVPETLTGLPVGTYVITILDLFGNDVIVITEVTQPPVLVALATPSNFGGFNVACNGGSNGSLWASATGGLSPYSYLWSNGGQQALAQNLPIGQYDLTVTDAVGCTATAVFNLDEPPPLLMAALFTNPVCEGPLTGSIAVQGAAGGIPPYSFSLNGSPFSDSTSYVGLGQSSYTMTVMDANGCTLDTVASLTAAIIPVLDLGENLTVELGDSIRLRPTIALGADGYAWTQTPGLSCYDCPEPWATTYHPLTYALTVTSPDGCTATDSVSIKVSIVRDVYIPNAFSPNGDGINDLFNVFGGGEVLRIKSFKIFNRWGDEVYTYFDFLVNAVGTGWDGTFKGKAMQPDVFAWVAEIEFVDGVTVLYKGDVMVVR